MAGKRVLENEVEVEEVQLKRACGVEVEEEEEFPVYDSSKTYEGVEYLNYCNWDGPFNLAEVCAPMHKNLIMLLPDLSVVKVVHCTMDWSPETQELGIMVRRITSEGWETRSAVNIQLAAKGKSGATNEYYLWEPSSGFLEKDDEDNLNSGKDVAPMPADFRPRVRSAIAISFDELARMIYRWIREPALPIARGSRGVLSFKTGGKMTTLDISDGVLDDDDRFIDVITWDGKKHDIVTLRPTYNGKPIQYFWALH